MRDGIIQINARPIRHVFLVDATDADSLQRVIEINTFLWGGKFNAIIPVWEEVPENWYDYGNINPQDIVSGYLNNFDPDYVVPMGECSNSDLNLSDRNIIDDHPSIFFVEAEINGTANYGISIFETLLHYIKNNEFEFGIMGTPFEICTPRFGDSLYPLLSSFFGTLPENITEILEQKFRNYLRVESVGISASNYAEFIKNQTHHSSEYLFTDQILSRREYLMGINTLGFSRLSGRSVIFFFDAENPIDIIDYWNLRAIGRIVYPIPKQFAKEESVRGFVLDLIGKNAANPDDAELDPMAWVRTYPFLQGVIKSSSVSDEEFLEFFNEFFNSNEYMLFQGNYPPMWRKLPVDDTRAMRSFSAGTAYHDIFDQPSNDGVIVKTLAPRIKTQSSFLPRTPRFANEIYFSFYNDKLITTSVLPEGFKDLSLFFQSDTNLRASKNNLVRLVYEQEHDYQIGSPPSEVIFESWMKSHGWEIEISNAGHIVTQIIRRLGIQFSQVFAIKGIICLLDKMNNGKSLLQKDLWGKIDRILQERCNESENLEYDTANILEDLVDANVLQPGMKMSCRNCNQWSWYSVEDVGYMVKCPECFGTFDFPFNPGNKIKWAYRTIGAFDSPNKSEGTYTVLLLLRFFSDRQMLGGAITPLMSFNLKKQNIADQDEEKITEKEFDLALFFQMLGRDNIETIFAECKTSGDFSEKDIEKMEILGKKFPDAILTFAKLSNLEEDEKKSLSDLVLRSDNPILILTGEDLLRQSLDEEHNLKGYADFDELCRRTRHKHLEVV